MNISQSPRSTMEQATEEETAALDYLKTLIHDALADGKITKLELTAIRAAVLADGKISEAECELYSSLILEKFKTGEVEMER